MKVCALALMVFCLLLTGLQGKVTKRATGAVTNINNYYIGTNSTLLVTLIKSLLFELRKAKVERPKIAKNCAEVLKCGNKQSGVYSVDPDGKGVFQVYCDQTTAGGGWAVLQKRRDGSVNFYRGWNDYKNGFGDLKGEFWLGLDKINRLTHQTRNRLRVELEDTTGKSAYAEYDYFAVASEPSKYKLSLGTYSGTAGDSLGSHRNAPFSTKDRDNDLILVGNCAVAHKGAWWYKRCHSSNLNGLYYHGAHKSSADGVNWLTWRGHKYSAKRAEMKIRPV